MLIGILIGCATTEEIKEDELLKQLVGKYYLIHPGTKVTEQSDILIITKSNEYINCQLIINPVEFIQSFLEGCKVRGNNLILHIREDRKSGSSKTWNVFEYSVDLTKGMEQMPVETMKIAGTSGYLDKKIGRLLLVRDSDY